MKVEILFYKKDIKNDKRSYFDCRVEYEENKWEIFRNAIYFDKDGKEWITFGSCLRDDKWLPRYERSGNFKYEIYKDILKALKSHIEANEL